MLAARAAPDSLSTGTDCSSPEPPHARAVVDYQGWLRWHFELTGCYDRAVASRHRELTSWDSMLTGWQIRRGTVELCHGAGRLCAQPGDWVLIPPGLARRHRFTADACIRSLRCAVRDGAGQAPGIGLPPLLLRGGSDDLAAAADALVAAAPPVGDDGRWRDLVLAPQRWAVLQGAVLGWAACALVHLGVDPGRPPLEARVAAAQRLLRARPGPAVLPWSGLREATGLSRAQLDRLFRTHCGASVRQWMEARLLADACHALEDQGEPVKAVAARLGFGDASHFARWFAHRTGSAPQGWRRQAGV